MRLAQPMYQNQAAQKPSQSQQTPQAQPKARPSMGGMFSQMLGGARGAQPSFGMGQFGMGQFGMNQQRPMPQINQEMDDAQPIGGMPEPQQMQGPDMSRLKIDPQIFQQLMAMFGGMPNKTFGKMLR